MRKFLFGLLIVIFIVGVLAIYDFVFDRAPPHRFVVNLDEPAKSVFLTLGNSDGDQTTKMKQNENQFQDSRDIADSSGTILINFKDGTNIECSVDYITNGEREPHIVNVVNRSCPEIGSHVQH